MEPRITPAEAALLMPYAPPRSPEAMKIDAVHAAARRERDDALAARLRAALAAFGGFVRNGAPALRGFLTALRRREETIELLRALDDRQLRDVGVLRGNIPAAANDAAAPPRKAA